MAGRKLHSLKEFTLDMEVTKTSTLLTAPSKKAVKILVNSNQTHT